MEGKENGNSFSETFSSDSDSDDKPPRKMRKIDVQTFHSLSNTLYTDK